jgi:hypothetical protein
MPSLPQSLNLEQLVEYRKPHTIVKVKGFQCTIEFHQTKGYLILFPQEFWDKLSDNSYRQAFLTDIKNKHFNREAR